MTDLLPETPPKSFFGQQVARFQMGNKWFTTVLSKGLFVLSILTYLEVKDYDVPWTYGIPLFVGILFAIFLIGCLDDWRGWTKKELVGTMLRFSPWWNPEKGYYGKKMLHMEQRIDAIWDIFYGDLDETTVLDVDELDDLDDWWDFDQELLRRNAS